MRTTDFLEDESHLYGRTWVPALTGLLEVLRHHAVDVVDQFNKDLLRLPRPTRILEALSEREREHLQSRQIRRLHALAAPDLTALGHREMALLLGREHATMGLDQDDLFRSRERLLAAIHEHIDTTVHGDALWVLAQRLAWEAAWQAEACQELQNARQDVLLRITRLAWKADSYTDLIGSVVAILGTHTEVAACSVGRPDSRGVFRFEAASTNIANYLADLENLAGLQVVATDDRPQGKGAIGQAWRSGRAERIVNFQTDAHAAPWKELAQRKGFRSIVAIPLSQPDRPPMAVLSLYSAFPGGYAGVDQSTFIESLQTLLGFAIARIESLGGHTRTVPFATRQNWATLLRSDALQMHYQPMLDLKTGRVTEVEALARLQDGDRLLAPAEFFPALSSEDFLQLYVRGLRQALSHRNLWRQSGIDLNVSVNLPPSALSDIRYFEATRQALMEYECAPGTLTLEMLETDASPPGLDGARELAKFKMLGINLAEDDLGSGHSSLNRLRALPFDWIKVDRNIVSLAGQDASNVLRFIYQLTRLGHSLDKRVVVEGVESADLLEAIAILGADAAQGYGIARPMPARQVVTWMSGQPGVPCLQNPQSPLGKLARLLIWEERLHLISEDPPAFDRLNDIVKTVAGGEVSALCASTPPDSAGRVCPPSKCFIEAESVLDDAPHDSTPQLALIVAAVRYGSRSAAYQSARQQLVSSIMPTAVQFQPSNETSHGTPD